MKTTQCEVKHHYFPYRNGSPVWLQGTLLKKHGNHYICKILGLQGTGSYHHSELRFPLSQESKKRNEAKQVGLWWYCHDYHEGQDSWQYRILSCGGRYRPGALSNFDTEVIDEAEEYYNKLVRRFERGN